MISFNRFHQGRLGRIAMSTLALGAALAASGVASPAQASLGWQARYTYNVPTGTNGVFLHLGCPADAPVADSGAYTFNQVGQFSGVALTFNGPRLDVQQPYYTEWGWVFNWPSGSPAGTVVELNVHCVKK